MLPGENEQAIVKSDLLLAIGGPGMDKDATIKLLGLTKHQDKVMDALNTEAGQESLKKILESTQYQNRLLVL